MSTKDRNECESIRNSPRCIAKINNINCPGRKENPPRCVSTGVHGFEIPCTKKRGSEECISTLSEKKCSGEKLHPKECISALPKHTTEIPEIN